MMDAIGNYFHATAQRQYARGQRPAGGRARAGRRAGAAAARPRAGAGGKLDDAVAEYRAATRLLPHDAGVFHALGRALRRQGQTEEASTALRFALRMNPKLADAHAELAALLLSQRRVAESADACRAALALLPDRPEFHAQLADALAAAGEIESAVAEARARRPSSIRRRRRCGARCCARSCSTRASTPPALFVEHTEWDRIHGGQMRRAVQNYTQWEREPARGRRVAARASADRQAPGPPAADRLRLAALSPRAAGEGARPAAGTHRPRGSSAVALYSDAAAHDEVT